MRAEYDFSKGKRGAVIPQKGKTRISIFIDNAVLAEFRARAEKAGAGYQTMMNEALRAYLSQAQQPVAQEVLVSATYLACSPTGCLADAAMAADLIGRLTAAKTVNVTFTSLNGGKRITVPVPLTGFGDAAGVLGLAQK